MNDDNIYKFEIFGDTYKLQTSDGNRKALESVADYYKKTVETLYKANPHRSRQELLVLAGVKISDQLYQTCKFYENRVSPSEKENTDFLKESIKKLDDIIS